MDMRWTPCIGMVTPGIRAGLHRHEPVLAIRVRQGSARAREVRIQRSAMIVLGVRISPCRVRLPDLDESMRARPAIFVQNAPGQEDACSQRMAPMLTGQDVVRLADGVVTKYRAAQFRNRVRQLDERLRGHTSDGRSICVVVALRLAARHNSSVRHHEAVYLIGQVYYLGGRTEVGKGRRNYPAPDN